MPEKVKKDTILWMEDRPEFVAHLMGYCEKKGLEVVQRVSPIAMREILKEKEERIGLIILDLLLNGVNDLEVLGIPDSDTQDGYYAGWVILDKMLRPKEGPSTYAEIPILIFTSRPFEKKDKTIIEEIDSRVSSQDQGWVKYLEKGSYSKDGRETWEDQFKSIIHSVFNLE